MTDCLSSHWDAFLHVLGGGVGIAGTFLMATHYLKSSFGERVWVLVTAIWRGTPAKNAAAIEPGESRVKSLQGLAFIAIGFLLGLIPDLAALFGAVLGK